MEPWMWGIVAAVPVLGVGAAYASGAFSTKLPELNAKKEAIRSKLDDFRGDEANIDDPAERAAFMEREEKIDALRNKYQELSKQSGIKGGKKKTKKSKKRTKKTKRRS